MRVFGVIVLVIGCLLLLVGVSMDVTVATGTGARVYNIGLMNERSNLFTFGGGGFLVGLIMIALGGKKQAAPIATDPARNTRPCPYCAELVLVEAKKCKHCGSDITPVLEATASSTDENNPTTPAAEKPTVFMAKEGTPHHQKSSFEPPKKGGSRLEGMVIGVAVVLIITVVALMGLS